MEWTTGSSASLDFGRYLVAAGVVVAVVFAVLDPSPSAGLGLPARLAFWLVHAAGTLAALAWVQPWVDRIRVLRRRPWLAVAAAGLLGSLLFAPLALGLESLFGQPEDFDGKGIEGWTRYGIFGAILAEASELAPSVTVTWIVLQLPWLLQLDFRAKVQATAEPRLDPAPLAEPGSEPPTEPASEPLLDFFAALPVALGDDIVCLTSELHYLRAYTPRGKALVLYNLKDAVNELEGRVPGLRVHRSHWVARNHVRRLLRRGSGWACELSTGDVVPVSRRRAREVMDAFGSPAEYRTESS